MPKLYKKSVFFLIFTIIITVTALSGCTVNSSDDVYFIHATHISAEKDFIIMTFLMEKRQDKEEDYFIDDIYGESIEHCCEKLEDKYGTCYFATNRIYFFDSEKLQNTAKRIGVELCESNTLPTKSLAALTKGISPKELFESTKAKDLFKGLIKQAEKKKCGVVSLFSDICGGKKAKAPCFVKDKDGKIGISEEENDV